MLSNAPLLLLRLMEQYYQEERKFRLSGVIENPEVVMERQQRC